MEKKRITLSLNELDDIVHSLINTICDTDPVKFPYLIKSLDNTYARMKEIRNKWDRQIKEGAR